MRGALALILAAGCVRAPAAVSPTVPATLSADAVAAELGDAGVSAADLETWAPDAGADAPVQAVRGAALLPQGWRAFGPSCVVAAPRCVAAGQRLAGDDARIAELERVPPGVRPQIASALIGFGLGLVAGLSAAAAVCTAQTGNVLCAKR